MIIFITGVTGFLGCALARYFYSKGYEIRGSSHSADRLSKLSDLPLTGFSLDFDQPVTPRVYEGCEAVIHCAHDFSSNAGQRIIRGTESLRKAAQLAGVQQQLFVSSYSARPDALSEYGQTKYIIEQEFLASGLTVIRPGLIVGPGGLFAYMAKGILKTPCIPLPEGGRAPSPVIALTDLLDAIYQIILYKKQGAYNLFTEDIPTMSAFIKTLCKVLQKKPILVNMPTRWLCSLNRWLRVFGMPLRGGLERIETMHLNMNHAIHQSDLPAFITNPLNTEQMVIVGCKGLVIH